ncbi:hypothetical protein Taro_051469 [Colocasia esculenta]|uniref:Uncharacterized protein n=1 Tax=Colocasia esculenta TaxID=4460 RepID=A0A843XHA8_COLES|nr:hypothetical protein [Colocasia esculenta]
MRMDQQTPAQPVVPVVEEAVPAAQVLPSVGVEVLTHVFGSLWAGWLAQSTGLFSVPERDRGERRILIATPGDVAFWLPLFWLVVCMRATCRARGGHADVDRRIATGSRVAIWSRRSNTSLFSGASALVVLLGSAVHMRARVSVCVAGSVTPSVVTPLVWSPRFRGEPGTWVCSGFVQVQWYRQGLVVFLDTLALEESCRPNEGKTAGTATCVVVWLVSTVLVWFSGAAAGPFVRGCEAER